MKLNRSKKIQIILKFKINHKPKIFYASEEENIEHQKFLKFINNENI